jgi:hypothetical protein
MTISNNTYQYILKYKIVATMLHRARNKFCKKIPPPPPPLKKQAKTVFSHKYSVHYESSN